MSLKVNAVLDEELVGEAFQYAGVRTRRELVDLALHEFVENHRRHDVRELRGRVELKPDYDYKAAREAGAE